MPSSPGQRCPCKNALQALPIVRCSLILLLTGRLLRGLDPLLVRVAPIAQLHDVRAPCRHRRVEVLAGLRALPPLLHEPCAVVHVPALALEGLGRTRSEGRARERGRRETEERRLPRGLVHDLAFDFAATDLAS